MCRALIAGGGAPEIELAIRLLEHSHTLCGMEQYCFRAFADAMDVIPFTLAENAGLNPIATVTELRNHHAQGHHTFGINVRKVSSDFYSVFIWIGFFVNLLSRGLPFDAHCCHMGTAVKHPVPDRVKTSFVIWLTLTRSPECQSAQMSKIINDCLTCFDTEGIKGLIVPFRNNLTYFHTCSVCDVRVPSLISWRRTLFSLCWCHWVLFISLPKPSAASSKLTTSSVSQLLYIMSCLIVMVGLELFAFSRYCLIWPQSHCPVLFVCCGCMNDNTDWAISLSIPLLPSLPRGLNDTIKMSVLGSAGFEIPCSYSMGNYPGCLQLVEIYWNLKPSWKSWIYMILLEIFVYIVRCRWLTALVSNHDKIGYRYRIAYRRNW